MALIASCEPLHIFGVSLIGATAENAIKLGLTCVWIVLILS